MLSEQSTTSDGQTLMMYRYEDHLISSSSIDEWGWVSVGSARVEIRLLSFYVVRVTPKGCWIKLNYGERFVRNDARRKYAHPTKELARESFFARKERQCAILSKQLERAQTAIAAMLGKDKDFFS